MKVPPRIFLALILSFAAMTSILTAGTLRYRVVWDADPSSTATVAWERSSGEGGQVHFGTEDFGQKADQYPKVAGIARTAQYHEMTNCFARLTDLKPDTTYYFVIRDSDSTSRRLYFRTASDKPRPFTFCAGGDSRNFREPRQKANRMVAKLRPLFVAFTGDMINRDTPQEWKEWLDDWQLTITPEGRIFPILPHRGNHEARGNRTIYDLFDTTESNYYALNFNGKLMRFYVLNSEIAAGGEQAKDLLADLKRNARGIRHLCAGYHKPMRPVVKAKSEGNDEYQNWAQLFYQYGFDLVFESDSHAIKRTKPLRPSVEKGSEEGFVHAPNDPKATVYTGEGCWGAPLRAARDIKSWTLAADSFNGFDWVHVYPDRIELRTVQVDNESACRSNSDATPFEEPAGLMLWNPPSGKVLVVPGD